MTPEDIKKSDIITALEKSFILGWIDENGDITDRKIQSRNDFESKQRDFVINAKENINKQSPDQFMVNIGRNPFTEIPKAIGA